jgi:type IV pilus biogenesis protein CpaD/CtpE
MTRMIDPAKLMIVGLLVLAGCTDRDPYRRNDVWQPTGANAANLAAMAANPNDLIQGHAQSRIDTRTPVAAVNRLWSDNPRPLAGGSSGGSGGGGSGGSSGGGSGGEGGGGASPSPGG